MNVLPLHLRTSYPFAPHWLHLPEGRLHYVDTGGDGDVVLLLHGNPTWSFLWRDLIRSLALQGFRCIAPDHLGMGLSDKPDRFFRLADRIAHVEALIASLGLGHFHLGVHDWGGAIGFGVAVRQPGKIGKLLVTNTAAFHVDRIPRRIALCRKPPLGEFIVRGLNGFAWPATHMATRRRLSPTVRQGFLAPYSSWKNRAAVARFVQDIPLESDHPSRATLSAVESGLGTLRGKPMLIAWGGQDFCFDDHFFEQWTRRFPEACLRYQAKAGHYLLEDAAETLIPDIRAFFTA
ncbi:MAG: alpha/beta fold hydrolase [Puniceicoccales bacterium]|jgi:haloalkane dehalogenase|nr:alpha/beta fold hydrolase [Puniceicoccales bacterium]